MGRIETEHIVAVYRVIPAECIQVRSAVGLVYVTGRPASETGQQVAVEVFDGSERGHGRHGLKSGLVGKRNRSERTVFPRQNDF